MKLRALRLNQFRKFTTPIALTGLEDGLNVLTGPNEFGKSTLLRALQAVMFERHGSSAAPIKALCNQASEAAPVVEACFELDGESFVIRKRFLRKAYAKLRLPDGTMLEGEHAEDRLRELLAFARPGNLGAKPDDMGIWSLLWVSQGDALGSTDVPELARSTLRHALETSVGQILGGEQSQRLPAVIAGALGELVTSTGKLRGAYKAAQDAVYELENTLSEMRVRREGLRQDLDALESLRESLQRLQSDTQQTALRSELEQAQTRRVELGELNAKIETGRAELARHEMTEQLAGERLAQRLGLAERLDTAARRHRGLTEELAVADGERARLKRAVDEARHLQAQASDAKRAADAARQRASQMHRGAVLAGSLRDLCKRLEQAQSLAVAQRELATALELNKVSAAAMQAINTAALSMQTAQASLSAAATRMSFAIDEDAKKLIRVADKPLPEGKSTLEVVDTTSIEIRGIGSIVISPSIHDAEELRSAIAQSRQELNELLAEFGVESIAEAREQASRRETVVADARDTELRLESLAPANTGGVSALREETEESTRALASLQNELKLDKFPVPGDSQSAMDTTEQAAEDAETGVQRSRDRVDSASAALSLHVTDWEQRRAEASFQELELRRFQEELQHAEAPEMLQGKLGDASRQVAEQRTAIAALEAQTAGDTSAAVAARIQRLQESLQALSDKKADMEKEQARLQGSIANAEGAGLDEKLAETERALDFAQQELRRLEKEAAVLTLLGDTLAAAEQEAHDRFMAPVIAKVQPYLNVVFPGAKIDLDTTMEVSGIVRPGTDAQDFERLSMGTQEQITVLTRIAFAELMAEQGRPAMLVLDDALAYSDDARMVRLFDVLTLASRNVQILLLTCREHSFAAVGGHQLVLESVDEGELQSA